MTGNSSCESSYYRLFYVIVFSASQYLVVRMIADIFE